jgi:uncharacterized protein YidB (DUF937 family)
MARGGPSMLALLGVLAVAGYQHRDKLAELLAGGSGRRGRDLRDETGRRGGQMAEQGAASSAGIGTMLHDGIQDLVDRFRQTGRGETAESWVAQGPNRDVEPEELEQAIGAETLDTLAQQTGLSRQEILLRLSRELPAAVDRYTPEGRLPDV